MVSVFRDLELKMERVLETNTLTCTQQDVSFGMNVYLSVLVYEVFIQKIL